MILSLTDALACHALLNEVAELWDTPRDWQQHLATEAERIVGGFGGAFFASSVATKGWAAGDTALSENCDDFMRECFARCMQEGGHNIMPGVIRPSDLGRESLLLRHSDQEGGLIAYHRSEFYNRYLRALGTGDTVACYRTHPSKVVTHLTVLRELSDKSFDDRAEAILSFLNAGLSSHLKKLTLGSAPTDRWSMSPRLRMTLELLLQGLSEKELASEMGVKPNTAHEYVRALYRRFEVNSRAELMGLYIRRRNHVP